MKKAVEKRNIKTAKKMLTAKAEPDFIASIIGHLLEEVSKLQEH